MLTYRVDDMTCGHCVRAITQAVQAVDPGADVTVHLDRHLVVVEPRAADGPTIGAAIAEAGYSPVAAEQPPPAPEAVRAGGCGCGTGTGRCGS